MSVSSNVQYVWPLFSERRKIPRKMSATLRHIACSSIRFQLSPRLVRLTIENAIAAPTRNENAG